MKEYEYIVLATEEIFSHIVSSVICLENYQHYGIDNSFRRIFAMFNILRKDYRKSIDIMSNERLEDARLKIKCRYKREEILRSYIKELKYINSFIDYDAEARGYYSMIEKEDVETLEMQLMIYPYLLSLIRKNEEAK